MGLEAAVKRLARAAARVPGRVAGASGAGGGVAAEEVAALSARLDATLARLRAALPEADEAGLPDEGEEAGDAPRAPGG